MAARTPARVFTECVRCGEMNEFDYIRGVANAFFALAMLFALWFVCEWWIRRREARKGTLQT